MATASSGIARSLLAFALTASSVGAVPSPPDPASLPQGSVLGWGLSVVGGDLSNGFIQVAASGSHSLGLKADGSIVAWGRNGSGQNLPAPNTGFVAVAAGANHSLGLKADGSIVGWGDNSSGQANVPAPNTGFVAVAAGANHSLGLKADGSIVAWGNNSSGQANVPAPNTGFVAVAAGGGHNLGLQADGSIVAWGANGSGQTNVPAPNTGFVAVAAGANHSLGLKTDGSIEAWGNNSSGQANVPAPNTGFVAIAVGWDHSLGLKADGSIVAWGSNGSGQTNVPAPNTGFVGVAAGRAHSLGLKAGGSIVGWGSNLYGQTNMPAPNTGFVAMTVGWAHSLGLKADGSIVAWGAGRVSTGSFPDYGQSIVPAPNAGFVAIAAGEYHSLGLKADGSIVAWGSNDYGQTNVPGPNTGFVAVASGGYRSLGLKADGSIVGWGSNYYGQTSVPAPNTGFVGIAAGEYHSLALKADGSIVGWGRNDYGQTNVPGPNTGFVAIAAGGAFSLAIRGSESIGLPGQLWAAASYDAASAVLTISARAFDPNLGLKVASGVASYSIPALARWGLLSYQGDRWHTVVDLSDTPPPAGSHVVNVNIGRGLGQASFTVLGSGGTIRGFVEDGSRAPIAGAEVQLAPAMEYQAGLSNPLTTITDGDGLYRFEEVSPGWYSISAAAEGYTPDQAVEQLIGDELVVPFVLISDPSGTLAQLRGPMDKVFNSARAAMQAETRRLSGISEQVVLEFPGHVDAWNALSAVGNLLGGAATLGPKALGALADAASRQAFDEAMLQVFNQTIDSLFVSAALKELIHGEFEALVPTNEDGWRKSTPQELMQLEVFSQPLQALEQAKGDHDNIATQVGLHADFDINRARRVLKDLAFQLGRITDRHSELITIIALPQELRPILSVALPTTASTWDRHHETFGSIDRAQKALVTISAVAGAAAFATGWTIGGAAIAGIVNVAAGGTASIFGAFSAAMSFNGAIVYATCLRAWGEDMATIPLAYTTAGSFLESEATSPLYLRNGEVYAGHVTININEDYVDSSGVPTLSIGLSATQVSRTAEVRITNTGTSKSQFRVIANGWWDYRRPSWLGMFNPFTGFDATANSTLVKIPVSAAAEIATIEPGQTKTVSVPYTGFWLDLQNSFSRHRLMIDVYSGPFAIAHPSVPYFVNRDLFNVASSTGGPAFRLTIEAEGASQLVGGKLFESLAPEVIQLADGTLTPVAPTIEAIYASDDEFEVWFELQADPGAVVELRVYDEQDHCLGFDSSYGGVRQEFPGEFAGGDWRQQTVIVPAPAGETYRVTASLVGATSADPVAVSLWASKVPKRPAVLGVAPGLVTATVYAQEGVTVDITAAESGGQTPISQVGMAVGELLRIEGDGSFSLLSSNSKSFPQIAAGSQVKGSFRFSIDPDAPAGTYLGSAAITSGNAGSQLVDIEVVLLPPGDSDADGDADLLDWHNLVKREPSCLVGPIADSLQLICEPIDADGDGDMDLQDVARFQRAFGP